MRFLFFVQLPDCLMGSSEILSKKSAETLTLNLEKQ
jgi:hypothetical protein